MQINATEHVVPHDRTQTGMARVDVVKYMTYVSYKQIYRQQTVLPHVLLTGVTQTHVKYLIHIHTDRQIHTQTALYSKQHSE